MKIMVLLLSFIFIITPGCSDLKDSETSEEDTVEYPDSESWDAQMSFTKDGKRKAVLNAGYVAKYTKKKETVLKENIRVDFFDEEGNLKSYLTAKEGKVFDESKNMVATGNVIVIAQNGTHLFTEELHWNNESERIRSDIPVKITTDSDTLYGDSFSSDPDLIEYEITNTRGTSGNTISIED